MEHTAAHKGVTWPLCHHVVHRTDWGLSHKLTEQPELGINSARNSGRGPVTRWAKNQVSCVQQAPGLITTDVPSSSFFKLSPGRCTW